MDLVEKVELAGSYFEPRKNWNFKEWASQSFGVYHGDALIEIKLRFKKNVAKRAERVSFHPSQRTEQGRNGSLVVYLRCRGHQELFHELCHPDWVGNVVIEKPESLKVEYQRYLKRLEVTHLKEKLEAYNQKQKGANNGLPLNRKVVRPSSV